MYTIKIFKYVCECGFEQTQTVYFVVLINNSPFCLSMIQHSISCNLYNDWKYSYKMCPHSWLVTHSDSRFSIMDKFLLKIYYHYNELNAITYCIFNA